MKIARLPIPLLLLAPLFAAPIVEWTSSSDASRWQERGAVPLGEVKT